MFNLGRPGEGTDETEAEVAGASGTKDTGREQLARTGRKKSGPESGQRRWDKSGAESPRGDGSMTSASFHIFSKFEYYKP